MLLLVDLAVVNFKCSCVNKSTHQGGILFVSDAILLAFIWPQLLLPLYLEFYDVCFVTLSFDFHSHTFPLD